MVTSGQICNSKTLGMNFETISPNERGRLHANPNRNPKTQLAAIGTCDDYGAVGRDVITGIDGDLTAITIDGVEYAFDSAVDHTDVDAVEAAIADKLENAGPSSEYNIWVKARYVDSELSVVHDGRRTISVIDKSGGTFSATRLTSEKTVSKYTVQDVVGAISVSYGGTTQALANSPYAHSGTAGTDATTAASIETDLVAALTAVGLSPVGSALVYRETSGSGASVAVDNAESAYDITFWIEKPSGDVSLNGTVLKAEETTVEVV
jgi:hypothetical protein